MESRKNKLNSNFIEELLNKIVQDERLLRLCRVHLKFQYLQTETQKNLLKAIFKYWDDFNKTPTFGILSQKNTSSEYQDFLKKIKLIKTSNEDLNGFVLELENFIKDSKFKALYENIADLYNKGDKEGAIKEGAVGFEEIINLNFRKTVEYTTVFKGWKERQVERDERNEKAEEEGNKEFKITWGIHELDDLTRGGISKGDSALILARSGAGKSTFLRWIGITNARSGKKGIHFQLEGSKKACTDAYDAGWTGEKLTNVEFGTLELGKREQILKARKRILLGGGEIFVYASETFDSLNITEAREKIKEIIENYGKIDFVIFDYLEIATVKGSFANANDGERKRREEIANKMTNIAIEFDCAVITATQANDIMPSLYNNPDFCLTRSNISEFKGAVKPFSYLVTLNQTDDEKDESILRIFTEKFRKYKSGQTVKIYQSLDTSRFYDSHKTIEEFYQK
jgi:hypothetical protein